MENQTVQWGAVWTRLLPGLALVAPASWFIASLFQAAGYGTLPGDLFWVSGPEGFIMTLGAPFFAATFIFMGRTVAQASCSTGVLVTFLGMMGAGTLATISGFRLFATVFVEHGIDANAISAAFNAPSNYYIPFLVLQLSQFIAWIITGYVVLSRNLAPKWAGLFLILGVPTLIAGQFFLFRTEILWPLANLLWLAGIWGIVRANKAVASLSI